MGGGVRGLPAPDWAGFGMQGRGRERVRFGWRALARGWSGALVVVGFEVDHFSFGRPYLCFLLSFVLSNLGERWRGLLLAEGKASPSGGEAYCR